jgi:enterochelin esterase-like enzyme
MAFPFIVMAGEQLKHGPDSEYHDGVPKGKVEQQPKWKSQIFPGTERDWWIYVPAQYDAAKSANVMVFQDGGGPVSDKSDMRAPVVFDNLIHKKEMPVTIGIFLNPGVLPPSEPVEIKDADGKVIGKKLPRQNRSFEYDSMGDRYARFLLEEILPEVEKKYNLTKDPAGRAICGQSSGGSCAFTVAWERPDAFGKVVSGIGSFTSLHGCNAYPDLIRKMEPKPIRIYMQDGDHDLDIYGGSWWHANLDMASAFNWMGYDYYFLQGHDGHSGKQLGANFPDAMRWLWRDAPVQGKRPDKVDPRGVWEVLIKDEGWKKVADATQEIQFIEADDDGSVIYGENNFENRLVQLVVNRLSADGTVRMLAALGGVAGALKFGPDGKLFIPTRDGVYTLDKDGKKSLYVSLPKKARREIAIDYKGNIYLVSGDDFLHEQIGIVTAEKVIIPEKETLLVEDTWVPTGSKLMFTPDQGFLVACHALNWKMKSVRVEKSGSVAHGEDFYSLQALEGQDASLAGQPVADDKGRIYVPTVNGIQIFDQAGRVIGILTSPDHTNASALVFGGRNFDTLYAATHKGIYSRKLNARGVRSCKPPIVPKPPQM